MKTSIILCLALLTALATALPAYASYDGPMFDAHCHITRNSSISPTELIRLLKRSGLSGVFLFGPPSSTLALQRQDPDFVYPFASTGPGHKLKNNNPSSLRAALLRQINTGAMFGIGEVALRHRKVARLLGIENTVEASGPLAISMYKVARTRDLPVNVHVEHQFARELDLALRSHPNTTIIWAHSGDAPPDAVLHLMRKHKNLYADLSCRNPFYNRRISIDQQSIADRNWIINPSWKALLNEFPDRFLFGTDIGPPGRSNQIADVVRFYRYVLGQLDGQAARLIAYGNACRLIKKSLKARMGIR